MKGLITNIQRFSLHDGPGIRTTIFFKGCNLKCPWCSNPENISFEIEKYNKDGIEGIYGKEYDLDSLYEEIIKDKVYYETGGGVTFSGGECLLNFESIEPLLKKLKDEKIDICIETALTVPKKYINIALKYVDLFYVDIKILDQDSVSKINGNVNLFKENIEYLYTQNSNIILRIPIIPGYTYTEKNIKEIESLLAKYKFKRIELFKIHRLGESKYKSLNRIMPKFDSVNDEDISKVRDILSKYCEDVKIIKL